MTCDCNHCRAHHANRMSKKKATAWAAGLSTPVAAGFILYIVLGGIYWKRV